MENKRYLLALACVLASVGLVSCDDNDDKAQCDPLFLLAKGSRISANAMRAA